MLRRARELQATGLDRDGVHAALEADYPKSAPLLELRPEPARLTEAVAPETHVACSAGPRGGSHRGRCAFLATAARALISAAAAML